MKLASVRGSQGPAGVDGSSNCCRRRARSARHGAGGSLMGRRVPGAAKREWHPPVIVPQFVLEATDTLLPGPLDRLDVVRGGRPR